MKLFLSVDRPLKWAVIAAVLFTGACVTDQNHPAFRQAEAQCEARGHKPGTGAYDTCVKQTAEIIFKSWGRDDVAKGD